jgi:S1-C subfamily serine protease
MARDTEWSIPNELQPRAQDWEFDLESALSAVVALRSNIPEDAFTASILGTERGGSGVVIKSSGLVLTVGYLITEAETIWLTASNGIVVPGHALAYDQETGFGLVQALGRLGVPALELGDSRELTVGDPVVMAGAGGKRHAITARVLALEEFAGYWEYLLDRAIFTAPAHPFWGGAALIGRDGTLMGIGSLHVQQPGTEREVNMLVPIELLPPIIDEMLTTGRPKRPPRPWLGIYAAESDGDVVIAGMAEKGPAAEAGLLPGDQVVSAGEQPVSDLASLWRAVWACGKAGVEVPFEVQRDGASHKVTIVSADRSSFLKTPKLNA